MPMQMKCPNPACTTMLTVREEFAGKMIKCPTCAATLMVPQSAAVPAMAGVPAAPAVPTAPPMPAGGPAAGATPIPPEMGPPTPTPLETFWSLIDKNQLDKKSQMFLAAGLGAMAFLLFSMILPRLSVHVSAEAFGTTVGDKSMTVWWIATIPGAFFILGTLMEGAFLAAAFVKMHMFLRYGFFAATAWGLLVFVVLFFILLIDAFSGGSYGSGVKAEVSVGIGTYFAILAALGIAGSFGLLSYPEVMKLLNKQQAKPLV